MDANTFADTHLAAKYVALRAEQLCFWGGGRGDAADPRSMTTAGGLILQQLVSAGLTERICGPLLAKSVHFFSQGKQAPACGWGRGQFWASAHAGLAASVAELRELLGSLPGLWLTVRDVQAAVQSVPARDLEAAIRVAVGMGRQPHVPVRVDLRLMSPADLRAAGRDGIDSEEVRASVPVWIEAPPLVHTPGWSEAIRRLGAGWGQFREVVESLQVQAILRRLWVEAEIEFATKLASLPTARTDAGGERLSTKAKIAHALILLQEDPSQSNARIAAMVGLHPSALTRSDIFWQARANYRDGKQFERGGGGRGRAGRVTRMPPKKK